MAETNFRFEVNNIEKFRKLMEGKKEEILREAGKFVVGEAQLRVPVDTGVLKESIEDVMDGDSTILIGTEIDYSEDVEFGNSKQSAQPYLLPAFEDNLEELKSMMRAHYAEIGGSK